MSGFFENLLQDAAGTFFGSDYLRDYTHASKTFRTNAYQYSPKYKFLFHVYFDINTNAYTQNVGTGANFGLAVKTVKLPSFTINTNEMNQYNRKRIVQSKIHYDDIQINFHDDNGNMINNLWYAYYTYYYADATKPQVIFAGSRGSNPSGSTSGNSGGPTGANYNNRNIYQPSISGDDNWGYIGETNVPGGPNPTKPAFFKNITVFGFNQHNFIAYTLINPMISRFGHDTYSYSDGQGVMENQMTIQYETVVYNQGAIDGRAPSDIVTGFGLNDNYDRTLSPIARPGSNKSILGQGGLVDGVGGTMKALGEGNFLGAIQAAGTTYNTFKNANLKQIAKSEVLTGITNAVQQTPNRNLTVVTPIFGASPSNQGTAGQPMTNTISAPPQVGANYAGTRTP
jgi:hypothetical protein